MCQKGGAVTDDHRGGALGMLWVFEPRLGVKAPLGSWGSGLHSPGSWLRFDWKERSVLCVRLVGGSAGPKAPTLLPARSLRGWNGHVLLALRSLDSQATIM